MIFSVIDWETTGLPLHPSANLDDQPRAIEFGAILTDGKEIIDSIERIINPERKIEQLITKLTGLTNDELASEMPFKYHSEDIFNFVARSECVISHNLSFDKSFFVFESKRLGKTLDDIGWPKIECCTVEQTFHMFGRRMKLSELYELKFGEYEQKHRAMDDILLLHEICKGYGIYESIMESHND